MKSPQPVDVNLSSVVHVLWLRKIILAGVILGFLCLGFLLAFSLDQDWVSRASVSKPQTKYMGQLWHLRKIFYEDKLPPLEEWSEKILADYFTYLSGDQAQSHLPSGTHLEVLYRDKESLVKIELHSNKKRELKESFSRFLEESQRAFLKSLVQKAVAALEAQKMDLKDQFESRREGQIQSVTHAMDVARAYGISSIKADEALGKDRFLFLLGQNFLRAQRDYLEKTDVKDMPQYLELNKKIAVINDRKYENDPGMFTLVTQPTKTARSWPKRLVVILMSGILGLFIGVWIVLTMDYFKVNYE